jgi:RNA polymerase sigma-70 factor (ECF subfamily)
MTGFRSPSAGVSARTIDSDVGGSGSDSDRQLWAAAADGDRDAFGVLFDRYARAVYNHCFRLTASWSTAEELVSVTFLQAWRRRTDVRLTQESALPWLLTVATNAARDEWRSARRRAALAGRLRPEAAVADHADDVSGRVDDERRMAELLAAVRALPRAEREALVLCVWSEVSYPDAAAVLGIAEPSVRSRVSRARARLTRVLGAAVDPRKERS